MSIHARVNLKSWPNRAPQDHLGAAFGSPRRFLQLSTLVSGKYIIALSRAGVSKLCRRKTASGVLSSPARWSSSKVSSWFLWAEAGQGLPPNYLHQSLPLIQTLHGIGRRPWTLTADTTISSRVS